MKPSAMLVAWFLMASMQTLRCTGDRCQVVPQSVVAPQRLTRFDSRLVCENYRQAMERQTLPVVHTPNRPDVRILKQITYACKEGV